MFKSFRMTILVVAVAAAALIAVITAIATGNLAPSPGKTTASTTPATQAPAASSKPTTTPQNPPTTNSGTPPSTEPVPGMTGKVNPTGAPKQTIISFHIKGPVRDGNWAPFTLTIIGGMDAHHPYTTAAIAITDSSWSPTGWADVRWVKPVSQSYNDIEHHQLIVGTIKVGRKVTYSGWIGVPKRTIGPNGTYDQFMFAKAIVTSQSPTSPRPDWQPMIGAWAPYGS